MTSRFGKTYSRKVGEGTSKFDEVLSTKRGTLSTKWGDTTYKAKVGSKRAGAPKNDSVLEVYKRPRPSADGMEDPFGFDSDEESKPVSSRSASKSSPAKPASAEPPQSERPGISLDAGSSTASIGNTQNLKPFKLGSPSESEDLGGDSDFLVETSDYSQNSSSSSLVRNSNCRTYRRPNKQGSGKALDSSGSPIAAFGTDLPKSTTDGGSKTTGGGGGRGRGRTRDFTVLHPSSVSMCNVTIQPRAVEEFSADMGEAGWQRKKTEQQNTRLKPSHTKSKKASKMDLFGFEDADAHQEENSGDNTDGRSSYKIQYFGFDDMSDSDGADDDDDGDDGGAKERRRAKKAAAAQRAPVVKVKEVIVICSYVYLAFVCVQSPTKAVYNARHWTLEREEEPPSTFISRSQTAPAPVSTRGSSKEPTDAHKDDGVFKAPPPPPKVTKCVTLPTDLYQDAVTALKCRKEHKELYTVVQHVKHFNDVVEFGENQEFTDDFEYLATGLKSGQPLNTRCLSVISLATRCAMPSFRMHLRARGKVAQVFKTLNDAPQHPNLALCTASLMYILSRDRLNMDLDRSCLDLMIRLLELDQDQGSLAFSAREIAKMKEKIRKLCDTVHNKHLDLQNITTGHLAMETLLSLTSKRAGDWFKEELRLLGGLDHIIDKVKECVDNLNQEAEKEKMVSSLWGAERCLRVLESVTVHNPENQGYLIAYKDSSLIISSAKALRRCEEMIQRYSRELNSDGAVGKAVEDCMRAIIGVLLNLTHDNEWGSTKTGEQEDLIMTALNCVLKVPQYLPQEQRFDIRVLGLGLLINLVEYSARNKYCLMEMEMEGGQGPCDSTVLLNPPLQDITCTGPLSAIAALVQLFLQRERAAIQAEAQTDDLIKEAPKPALDKSGEWQETGGEIQWVANDNNVEKPEDEKKKKEKEEEDEELDLNKALQHAGKHMEDSIVASYTALLLGCLCQGSTLNVTTVRDNLPKGDFSIMTEMLKKFLNFMNLTCDVGTTGQKSISRIIDYLEHC
uniref:Wings apart-like protein homolog n=1 Tax=Sander lucioperca TaxID=283035 RepID=A0A8C9Z2N5_SANLU